MIRKNLWFERYRGYTIFQRNGIYRADTFCDNQFKNKNLEKLNRRTNK
jgi:hypothetical protein